MKWDKQKGVSFYGNDKPTATFDAAGATRRSISKLDDGGFRMWYVIGGEVHVSIGWMDTCSYLLPTRPGGDNTDRPFS